MSARPTSSTLPGPRRRFVPLAILVVLAVGAAVLGGGAVVVRRAQDAVPASVTRTPTATDAVDAACRPAVAAPASEPWLSGDGAAEKVWQQHSADLAHQWFLGQDGWIFWNDYIDSYASQAVGRKYLSASEVQNWVDYLRSIRDGLAAQGIQFYVEVTPSTTSVYPEQLPEWMQSIRGSTIMDQFVAAAGDLPVIDLREDLIRAKTDGPDPKYHLFSWDNSHWTPYGGYVGWEQIADCINTMHPDEAELQVPKLSGVQITGDYNEWASFGVASPGADWASPEFDGTSGQPVTVTKSNGTTETRAWTAPTDSSELPVTTTVSDSWTGKTALIARDSMGNSLSPYWQQAYSTTWQVGTNYSSYDTFPKYRQLVAQYHPNVVILQLAERHLVTAPPAGASY